MYASSSKLLARSALSSSLTITASRACFSTTRPAAANRETFVELLTDVQGLGRQFDRLFVPPGRARNDLVPNRQARFVPFKDNSQRQVYRATDADRQAYSGPLIEAPSSKPFEQREAYSAPEPTPQALLDSLHLIPSTLVFARKTISPDYPSLHGSLTLSDIQEVLATTYQLPPGEVEVSWVEKEDGARMKELDSWFAVVTLRKGGKESAQVEIKVVRE